MDRRSHYVETALALFTQHGFNGVSMDAIVAAAGGSKATLYRYFDSKEALFDAIIDDVAARLTPPDMPEDYLDLPLIDGLRLLGRLTVNAALTDRVIVLIRLAAAEYGRFPELSRLLFERGPGASYQRFRAYLAAKEQAGEIEVPDKQIAAEHFLAGLVAHQQMRMQLGLEPPTEADLEARIEAAATMFVRTYATVGARV